MDGIQRKVDELIREFGGYWGPFEMLAALMEEVGELSDEILRVEGVKGRGEPERVKEEIGDVAFALYCIANYYGIDVAEAVEETLKKYRKRDGEKWTK